MVIILTASCGKPKPPTDPGKPEVPNQPSFEASISAEGVSLITYSVEAGAPSSNLIEQGLQSAANALALLYAEKLKEYPSLSGNIRGTFHIEPDGTVRMFMEKDTKVFPEQAADISNDFIGATFGKKYRFPELGEDVLLKVDFQLSPE